jgi:YVTN family beta-propeller protein
VPIAGNEFRRTFLLAAGIVALAMAVFAPSALAHYAYTLNHGEGTVSAIDTATNQVVGSPIEVGEEPEAIAITPDGRSVYVASYGEGTVSAIDTATNQVVGSPIEVGEGPAGIAISPDGKTAYVTNEEEGTVSAIDTQTNHVRGSPIPVGTDPIGIAITPDGRSVYVASYGEGTVSVIDTATNHVHDPPIPVGAHPFAIAITPDGKTAYVTSEGGTVSAIDTATNQVVGSPIPVGTHLLGIAITPNGEAAYVVDEGGETVSVVDTQTNQVVGSPIPVGEGPTGIAITPDGKTAYVTNEEEGTVSVIDTATNQAGTPIPVEGGPWQIAIQPDQPPVASFAVGGSPLVGSPLAFNGAASSDPDGPIARYDWSFGDGQTALDAGPLVSHAYKAPGTYQATLKVTDAEGCSIGFVFTGQTAYCNGSVVAVKTQAIAVSYPSNRFRFGKVVRNRRNGTARLQVKVPGAGKLVLAGKKVRQVKRQATKAGTAVLTVRPRVRLNRALKHRHHARVKISVTFTPVNGMPSSESKTLKLIRRR